MIFAPDDFDGDWYGYATNQAGHAYIVGAPLALALSHLTGLIAAPVAAAIVYGIVWEWGIQNGRDWRDSLEDTVHVMSGASVLCAALSGDPLTVVSCMVAQGVLLGIGVYRRVWH